MATTRAPFMIRRPPRLQRPVQFHCLNLAQGRPFHQSSSHNVRRKRLSVRQLYNAKTGESDSSIIRPYTDAEKAQLKKRYSPSQLAAIEAGEAAISPDDLLTQGTVRSDPGKLEYVDALDSMHPVIDHAVRAPDSHYDPDIRMKDDAEINKDLLAVEQNYDPEKHDSTYLMRAFDDMRTTVGKEEAERDPNSAIAPSIPRFTEEGVEFDAKNGPLERVESMFVDKRMRGIDFTSEGMKSLMLETGWTADEIQNLRVKYLAQNWVANQTRLGKVRKMRMMCIVGDGHGLLGMGEGKNEEPDRARTQAFRLALKNLVPVRRYEQRTIFGDVKAKVGATEIIIMNRPPGFGVRCMHLIFEVCRCVGITDMAAKVTRSRNPMNIVKATIKALQAQRDPEEISRARSRKLVDAHDHARSASEFTQAGKLSPASEEHDLAANEFAKAATTTKDREALKILLMMESYHRKLARLIQIVPPRQESPPTKKTETESQQFSPDLKDAGRKENAKLEPRHKSLRQLSPDHGSSIADNLASIRGIPSRRDKALTPTISAKIAQGQTSLKRSPNQARRSSKSPQTDMQATARAEAASEQPADAFQTFYSAFGNVISKLSAPLAFAGLPLDGDSATDPTKDTATADTEVDHFFSKPALRAIREDRGHSAADSFYVVPTGGGTIPYSRIGLQNNKTSEELQIENATLKKLADVLSKRLHSWEANAQSSSMALQQSLRALSDHGQDERLQKLEEENAKLRKLLKASKPP
ncbi:MAG: 28S ribosomal protein S5, mitochondrial [Vezdaea aestivalis]|nr:MAG: 28S ribosomal protein S5, mitochondrial [Vezdaea aestivalis]